MAVCRSSALREGTPLVAPNWVGRWLQHSQLFLDLRKAALHGRDLRAVTDAGHAGSIVDLISHWPYRLKHRSESF